VGNRKDINLNGGVGLIGMLVGKVFSRIQNYATLYHARLRQQAYSKIARIDPSALLGPDVGIANNRGNPDDIVIGADCAVLGELITFPQGGRIVLGDKCFVGAGARLWSAASITTGSHVLIAHGVNIHDNIAHSLSWHERRVEIDALLPGLRLINHRFDLQAKPLTIGDDVWIGFGASIIGGVNIGRGAIIGAGTMVTKDVPPFTIVVGNPMRVVRTLEQDTDI